MGDTNPESRTIDMDDFFAAHPGIKVARPSDADFEAKTENWVHLPSVPWPLLGVRPQTEADVSALIAHLTSREIPFAMRGGGHDFAIRSRAPGAVQVDMRDIAHVRVAEGRETARIGPGALVGSVIEKLEEKGLMTTIAANGVMSWAGWAGMGGYGPFSALFGLGCDQIVGARVVLWDGRVVDADERLLKGIRGAIPAFGAVVELEIKVYPTREVTGGYITYSGDGLGLEKTASTWFTNFSANPFRDDGLLPPQLKVMPVTTVTGMEPKGEQTFLIKVTWTGPAEAEWEAIHAKLLTFAPGAQSLLEKHTPASYCRHTDEILPPRMYGGGVATLFLRGIYPSAETIGLITAQLGRKPLDGIFTGHMYQEPLERSAANPGPPSVWRTREAHYMPQLLGYATEPGEAAAKVGRWAREFDGAVSQSPDALEGKYFPLAEVADIKIEAVYKPEDLVFIRDLKREYDPQDFFRSIPLA